MNEVLDLMNTDLIFSRDYFSSIQKDFSFLIAKEDEKDYIDKVEAIFGEFQEIDTDDNPINIMEGTNSIVRRLEDQMHDRATHLPSSRSSGGIYNIGVLKDKTPSNENFDPKPFRYVKLKRRIDDGKYFGLITVGEENYTVAYMTLRGTILINRPALEAVIGSNIDEIYNLYDNIYKAMLFLFKKVRNYINDDIEDLEKDILSSCFKRILSRLNLKIAGKKSHFTREDISSIIVDTMSSMFDMSRDNNNTLHKPHYSLLHNKNTLYRSRLSRLDRERTDSEKIAYNRGINVGLSYYSALEEAGYHQDRKRNVWKKEINLIPTLAMKGGELFNIKEDYREYNITELFMTVDDLKGRPGGSPVQGKGKHPNMQQYVCVGDELGNQWHKIVSTGVYDAHIIKKYLFDVEDALQIVNFDSAYYSMENFNSKTESAKHIDPSKTSDKPKEKKTEDRRRVLQ